MEKHDAAMEILLSGLISTIRSSFKVLDMLLIISIIISMRTETTAPVTTMLRIVTTVIKTLVALLNNDVTSIVTHRQITIVAIGFAILLTYVIIC